MPSFSGFYTIYPFKTNTLEKGSRPFSTEDWFFSSHIHPVQFNEVIQNRRSGLSALQFSGRKAGATIISMPLATVLKGLGSRAGVTNNLGLCMMSL